MLISKRALCQLWAESVDCNLAQNWLFEMYELDAELEKFAEGLPGTGLAMIAEEIEARGEIDADLAKRHQQAFLNDEPPAFMKKIRYERMMNKAGLERSQNFMARAARHAAQKCPHFAGKSEYKDPTEVEECKR